MTARDRSGHGSRGLPARLLAVYGVPERPLLDPVSETVSTILSQNTSDINRDRAYERLRARFPDSLRPAQPDWEAVRTAPLDDVREAIRPAGLSDVKAPRIQAALETIRARTGALDLAFCAPCRSTRRARG
jgi:endonuclease-3